MNSPPCGIHDTHKPSATLSNNDRMVGSQANIHCKFSTMVNIRTIET